MFKLSRNDLTTGSIFQHLKYIAIPSSVGFIFRTLYNVVDTFFAGKLGSEALAGLSMSFPVFFIIIALSVGIGTGATSLLSIALGKRDEREFHTIIQNALVVSCGIIFLIMLFSQSLSTSLIGLMGAKGSAYTFAVSYVRILFLGSGLFIINQLMNAVLSAQGDTKSLRNTLIVGFLLNLILDPLLIMGWFGLPKLGVPGIAIATLITESISTVYLLHKLLKSPRFSFDQMKHAKFSIASSLHVLQQSIPASLGMMTIVIGSFVINFFVIQFGGETAIAAYGIAFRIEQLALLPALGLNVATLAIVGQNYGAKKYDRVSETFKIATYSGLVMITMGMLIIFPFSRWFISLFNKQEEVVQIGVTYLRIEVFTFYTYVILYISNSVLQGIKKPMFIVFIGLFRQVILPSILFYIFGKYLGYGLYGVWWGLLITNWTAVLLSLAFTVHALKTLQPPHPNKLYASDK